MGDGAIQFVQDLVPLVKLDGRFRGSAKFQLHLPPGVGRQTIADVFEALVSRAEGVGISDWGISQVSVLGRRVASA